MDIALAIFHARAYKVMKHMTSIPQHSVERYISGALLTW